MTYFTNFSKAKAFLFLLATAILCLSISILGLSGHGIAHYLRSTTNGRYEHVRVDVSVWNSTTGNASMYNTRLAYAPGDGLEMGDMYALLMSGILGTVFGGIIVVASVWTGDSKVNISLTGRTVRPIRLLGSTTTLLLDAALLLTFVSIAGYTWTQASTSSYYIETENIPDPQDQYSWYNSNDFTFERWNCALAWAASPNATHPSAAQLFGLCQQARVARELVLALLVVGLSRLGAHYWVWRRHNIAVRLAKENNCRYAAGRTKRVGSVNDDGRQRNGLEEDEVDLVELPANRLSRFEAEESAAVGEMQGENGSKELPGAVVAIEMEDSRRGKT